MGIARLLAKGWIVFCLFAGAHALRIALVSGLPLASSLLRHRHLRDPVRGDGAFVRGRLWRLGGTARHIVQVAAWGCIT